MLSKTENKKSLYRVNVTELAERIGRTRTWTSLVLNGKEKSLATRKLIAAALGAQVSELWQDNGQDKAA